jgi:hypothetical protein
MSISGNGDVEARLIRIETKLDLTITSADKLGTDHEDRLRAVERKFWIAIGMALASLSANAGQFVNTLGGGM